MVGVNPENKTASESKEIGAGEGIRNRSTG